jgi:hypothetical protein
MMLTIALPFTLKLSVPDLLEIIATEAWRGRASSLSNWEGNRYVGWRAPFVTIVLSELVVVVLVVVGSGSAIKGVERGLTAQISRTSRASDGNIQLLVDDGLAVIKRVERGLATKISRTSRASNRSIAFLINDRFLAIGREGAVGNLGSRWLVKQLGALAAWTAESVLVRKTVTFMITFTLGHWGRRTATVDILVNVDVAAASRKSVVFGEAIVAVVIIVATRGPGCITAGWRLAPHPFEPIAIPSLTTSGVVVNVAEVAGGSSIHGSGWANGINLLMCYRAEC